MSCKFKTLCCLPVVSALLQASLCTATAADFSAWQRKMKITFLGYDKSETLTNFPALVTVSTNIDGFLYSDFESSGGGDLRFAGSNETTELNYEIEEWDTNASSYIWVQVPELANTNDFIYAYWGKNTNAPAYTTNGAAWSNGYAAVWHLAETNLTDETTGGTNRDATANANHGIQYRNSPAGGMIAGGQSFDGATDYIDCGNSTSLDIGSPRTISAWINASILKNWGAVVGKNSSLGSPWSYMMCCHNDGTLIAYDGSGWTNSANAGIVAGNWYHVVFETKGDGNIYFYVNGQSYGSAAFADTDNPSDYVYIGSWYAVDTIRDFNGVIDEVRMSNVARGSNWVWACWMSQGSNSTFNSYEVQDISFPAVNNYDATNITGTNASLIGDLISTGAAPTEVYCYWGQTNGYTTKGDWATNDYLGTNDLGLLTNNVSGLTAGTLYYYRFYATNSAGDDWANSSASFVTVGGPTVNNDGGATNVTATSATLRGEVTGGNPTPTAYIYWGLSDQGTNKTAWSNEVNRGALFGAFSTGISGLLANQTNYYRCFATNSNGGAWAPATTNFTTDGPTISISDAEVTEGDSGTTNAVFMVTLSATSAVDVTVNFVASNGTAEAGTDFNATNGTLTIVAGVVSNTITVKVNGDTFDEYPSQNFYVNLSNPTNATISYGQGIGTIIDDDDAWDVKIWTGTGNWTSYTNWTPAGMPSAADDAIIASGAVTLSNSATIASITVSNSATLTFTGTNNALIVATNVVVNGTITHTANTATTTNEQGQWVPDGRVYIICSNLTVASGAAINVDAKGYDAQAGPGAGGWAGGGSYAGAGGYGGVGGNGSGGSSDPGGAEYGSATNPVDPGSGGGRPSGGRGAGWVTVEATGRVTVDGTITANGGNGSAGAGGGAGSGGGIYITCNTFAGIGEVRANGGANSTYGQAAGGRIALHYNIAAQAVLNQTASPTVKLIAKRGSTGYNKGRPGTVYLSDAGFWPSNTLYAGQLIIPGFVLWRPDSVTANEGLAVFTNGFQLIVTNNVSIGSSGGIEITNGVLSVGGMLSVSGEATIKGEISVGSNMVVNGGTMRCYSASTNAVTLNIGGNLWMNSGKLYVYSAATNSVVPYGAQVNIVGDATVTNSSWIYPYSNSTNGGSPFFLMRNLLIGSNAGFYAYASGFAGSYASPGAGYGPGGGTRFSNGYGGGGGYGGKGGDGSTGVGGPTYGSSNAPIDAGSGSGYGEGGGGLVRVEVTYTATINGTINANGYGGVNNRSGGSGGGIYLRCRTFTGTNSILTANGGTGPTGQVGGGGGGRIAVWRTYHRVDTNTWTVSVDGGSAWKSGEDGTIFWGYIPPKGTIIRIH